MVRDQWMRHRVTGRHGGRHRLLQVLLLLTGIRIGMRGVRVRGRSEQMRVLKVGVRIIMDRRRLRQR